MIIKINNLFDIDECDFLKNNSIIEDYYAFEDAIREKNCYEWYYSIANYLKPKSILEIGVRYGFSLCSMALGCDKNVYLEGWDILDDYNYIGSNIKVLEYAEKNLNNIGYYNVVLKNIDSHSVNKLSKKFDLVHIDGDHEYEGVLMDLNLIKKNAKYIIVDDYTYIQDVKNATNLFVEQNINNIESTHFFNSFRGTFLIKTK